MKPTTLFEIASFGLIILMLALSTYERNRVWQSPIALWADAARKSPDKDRPLVNIGRELIAQGRHVEARPVLEAAAAMKGPFYSLALNNLGIVCGAEKKIDEAILCFREALVLEPQNRTIEANLKLYLKRKEADELLR